MKDLKKIIVLNDMLCMTIDIFTVVGQSSQPVIWNWFVWAENREMQSCHFNTVMD